MCPEQAEQERIPGVDLALGDGDVWQFGSHAFHIFDTPGHTAGHITYWVPSLVALFTGADPGIRFMRIMLQVPSHTYVCSIALAAVSAGQWKT